MCGPRAGLGAQTFALSDDDHRVLCDPWGVPHSRVTRSFAYKSIIWFTIWSSIVHAVIMAAQSFSDQAERGHLIGDVPALLLVAIVLTVLMPRTKQA